MTTINPTPARDFTWDLGTIMHKGQPVEVWQRCRSCDRFDLDEDNAVLTTPEGYRATIPEMFHIRLPQDIRRCLIVSRISQALVGVTLRLPDLDIDIDEQVMVDLTSSTNLT